MVKIREAQIGDANLIFDFISKLAKYEKMEDDVTGNAELINKWVFEEKLAKVIFVLEDEKEVGFALYFYNFSTFVTKPGLYLEDLFILEESRNKGYGKLVFNYLMEIVRKEDLGRMEWVCLDWNQPSIDFYINIDAKPVDGWTIFRLDNKTIMEKQK